MTPQISLGASLPRKNGKKKRPRERERMVETQKDCSTMRWKFKKKIEKKMYSHPQRLLLLLLDGWMGIENKIPSSLRKSQQVKADCSCWMKSMNLETASPPLPLSPSLPASLLFIFFWRKREMGNLS